MNKKIFYRNNSNKLGHILKPSRSNKLSMDDLTSLISRQPSQAKKRNSNDHCETKIQRSTFKKNNKMNATSSVGNSAFVTKSSSPLKFNMRGSEVTDQKNHLKTYKFYYQIGFGGFGRVWKVYNKQEMKDYAMKQISKKKVVQKNNIQSVLNQRKILSKLHHPFLINMKCSFQDQLNLYLVMDYLRGGDLRYHICYKERFSERQIKFITACILIGLQYIHSNHIIHKDLKPQNIVFQENGYARVTDFGIAKSQLIQNTDGHKNQSSGTPVYMAPQVLFKKDYSYQSDFYALGVIVYELAMGKRPYEGKNRTQIRDEIIKKDVNLNSKDLPQENYYLADLINKLLRKNPNERLGHRGIQQIKQHRYFSDIKWGKMQKKEVKPPFIPHVISQMKEYLDEIALFNQMHQQGNEQNIMPLSKQIQLKFQQYDFQRVVKAKAKNLKSTLKKCKRMSQKNIMC